MRKREAVMLAIIFGNSPFNVIRFILFATIFPFSLFHLRHFAHLPNEMEMLKQKPRHRRELKME